MGKAHLVGLITDTHDNKHAIEKAVELFNARDVGAGAARGRLYRAV